MDDLSQRQGVTLAPHAQTEEEWELERLNANLHRDMDWEALRVILEGEPDGEVVKRWRLSTGLTANALAIALHYSRRHIVRVENGHYPVTGEFLKNLRPFAALIGKGIPYMPHAMEHYPRPPELREIGLVKKARIAGRGVWRECPGCGQKFLYTNPRRIYHSKRCKDRALRRGESVGKRDRGGQTPGVLIVRCPSCGDLHPVKGNLVAQSAGSGVVLRGDSAQGDGGAEANAERQVEAKAGGGEIKADEGSNPPGFQFDDKVLYGDVVDLGFIVPLKGQESMGDDPSGEAGS